MAIRDIFKVSRKTFFNPRAWLNYDELANQNRALFTLLGNLFTVPVAAPIVEETFEQSMQRHGMTEADLKVAIKNYRLFALLFVALGSLAFIYAFFILFAYGTIAGWLLAMCVCSLLLTQAFKYDFWALQLRQRKLTLTFKDWKTAILGGKGTSHD